MSDRPEIEIHQQITFGDDGRLEVTESSVETSLEDLGADVDQCERDSRIDRSEATEFGVDDRPEVTRSSESDQSNLFVEMAEDQQTLTDDAEFSIWGYDAFEIYEADDKGLPDYEAGIATHGFLRDLSEYIAPDGKLDIQTAGYAKCRFPVHAQRYVVQENEVLHANLQCLDAIDQ